MKPVFWRILTLCAVTLAAYLFADAASVLTLAPPMAAPAPEVMPKGEQKSGPLPLKHFQSIASRDLFGVIAENPMALARAVKRVKKVPLDEIPVAGRHLTLKGTVVSADPAKCFAVVAKGRSESLFLLGDEVFGAKLTEVRRRAVVLEKNGREEALFLDDAGQRDVGSGGAEESVFRVSRGQVRKALAQMDDLLMQARMEPATRGGERGINVAWVKQGSLFDALGLKKNDFIFAVNGTSVTGAGDAVGLLGELEKPRIVVEMLRGGGRHELVLNIN